MSLVTTPRRASPDRAPQSAAINDDLPDPTGPPTPIRRARSTGKEALPLLAVDRRIELDRDRGGRGQRGGWGRIGDRARGELHGRRELGQPARGQRRVEGQQLQRGRGD